MTHLDAEELYLSEALLLGLFTTSVKAFLIICKRSLIKHLLPQTFIAMARRTVLQRERLFVLKREFHERLAAT